MKKLLIGSENIGKTDEMRLLLGNLGIEIIDLSDFENIESPIEDGRTFEENAEIKARAYSLATGCCTVADDSGLEVVALGQRPGVFSARFAGEGATDQENNSKLLNEMKISGVDDRSARFVCAMCLVNADGQKIFSDIAYCKGRIATKPIGFNGFGYDPLFIPNGRSQTFGQLSAEVKQSISHRSLAAAKLGKFLALNIDLVT